MRTLPPLAKSLLLMLVIIVFEAIIGGLQLLLDMTPVNTILGLFLGWYTDRIWGEV
jgi:hypothetical protein